MSQKRIFPVKVNESCTVEIGWILNDGGIFYQRIDIPPKSTREARKDESTTKEGQT